MYYICASINIFSFTSPAFSLIVPSSSLKAHKLVALNRRLVFSRKVSKKREDNTQWSLWLDFYAKWDEYF